MSFEYNLQDLKILAIYLNRLNANLCTFLNKVQAIYATSQGIKWLQVKNIWLWFKSSINKNVQIPIQKSISDV